MEDVQENEPKVLPSNEFWGKRSGSWDDSKINGQKPVGNVFRQSQWGSGQNNSGKKT